MRIQASVRAGIVPQSAGATIRCLSVARSTAINSSGLGLFARAAKLHVQCQKLSLGRVDGSTALES